MDARGIDADAVLRVLRLGDVEQEPEQTPQGDWKIKIVHKLGGRHAAVVTVLVQDRRLVLLTTEWEDGR